MRRDAILMMVLAILILAACIVCYMFYKETQTLQTQVENLTRERDGFNKQKNELTDELTALSNVVGWSSEGNYTSIDQMQEELLGHLEPFPKDWNDFINDNLNYRDSEKKGLTRLDGVIKFQHDMIVVRDQRITELKGNITGLQGEIDVKKEELVVSRTAFMTETKDMLKGHQNSIDGLNSRISQLEGDLRSERTARAQEVSDITNQRDQIGQAKRVEETNVARLKNELTRITEGLSVNLKSVEVEADGRVVFVADDFSTVYIDLTTDDRIYPGLTFQVFREKKDGTWHLKGTIEIKKVLDTMSEARIVDMRSISFPIMPDDLIVNPIFDPGKTYHIGFVGSLSGNSTWNVSMLTRLIEDSGGVFDGTVTAKTDFIVILGEPGIDDLNWIRTKEYNKQVMTVREFTTLFGK